MVSLKQVQLLEEKVSKTIDYVKKITAENEALLSEKASLTAKMDAYQKRIDELEVHILRFKEDQGRIEDGIMAALDRLSQFEDAFEKSIKQTGKPRSKASSSGKESASKEIFFELPKEEATVTQDSENEDKPQEDELDIF